MTLEKLTDDPKIKEWLDHQVHNLEQLDKSVVFASIMTPNFLKAPECMLQIGAAICLGKPIILIVFDETDVPKKLAQIADKIIVASRNNPDSAKDELTEFLRNFRPTS